MALVLVSQDPNINNSVHEIIPQVYLGNCDARFFVSELGIRSIVQIGTEEEHQQYSAIPDDVLVYKITIPDSSSSHIEYYFDSVVDFAMSAPKPILFHCNAGVSRSPTLLSAFLLSSGLTVDESISLIRERRMLNGIETIYTEPKESFLAKLCRYNPYPTSSE